jgi:hypothetical protein
VAPVCSNCNGTDFVWANELKTGMTGGGALSIRARGDLPLGTRICRSCGHADLFLRDISILHQPHLWRPGEFIPIVSKSTAKPATHHAAEPATATPVPVAAPMAPAVTSAPAPTPTMASSPPPPVAPPVAPTPPEPMPPAPEPMNPTASEPEVEAPPAAAPEPAAEEPPAEKPKPARRRSSKSRS